MKTMITVVACTIAVALAGYVAAPNYDQERCLYSAVSAYPSLPADRTALDVVPECSGVSAPDKVRLREMVSRFITSAADKSAQGR